MNTLQKRHALNKWCDSQRCSSCVLGGDVCRCGHGTSFLSTFDDETNQGFEMTDGEIEAAYDLVFGKRLLQIKTIRSGIDFAPNFDKAVNDALREGWTLKRRYTLPSYTDSKRIMLIAELEKEEK